MRTALVGAAALTTALAGVAAAVPSHTASFSVQDVRLDGQTPVTSLDGYGSRGTNVVIYRHNATMTLSVGVTNTGRLPATVTGIDLGGQRLALLTPMHDLADVELVPGESRRFDLLVRVGNCRYYHEREVATYDGVRVHFAVIGGTGDRTMRLQRPFVVHSPMIVGCPDRKLDRSAVNRRR